MLFLTIYNQEVSWGGSKLVGLVQTIVITDKRNCISGVMVNMLTLSVVDPGFKPRSGQTKDYKIGICCFSTKPTALRWKSKDWLARNQNNVS